MGVLIGMGANKKAPKNDKKLSNLKAKISELEKENITLITSVENFQKENENLKIEKESLTEELEAVKVELKKVKAEKK